MAISRRKEIIELTRDELKKINGDVSTFDSEYTYSIDVAENVFRFNKFIDQINDFPTICLVGGAENRIYHSYGLITGELPIGIRAYIRNEEPITVAENLADDIAHIIYNLGDRSDMGIQDMIIDSVSTDGGLLNPYGILEVIITTRYQLNI
tara:strand:- start:238 stop:690 length:453 start_codon:yes stop_codon:yes gene_type:complete